MRYCRCFVSSLKSLKLLFVSTPVGALGSGTGGGVELTVLNMTQILQARGHRVDVLAPKDSHLDNDKIRLIEVDGTPQPSIQTLGRDSLITMTSNGLLGNMWEYVRSHQQHYDLILSLIHI